jgi:hypothetical protein
VAITIEYHCLVPLRRVNLEWYAKGPTLLHCWRPLPLCGRPWVIQLYGSDGMLSCMASIVINVYFPLYLHCDPHTFILFFSSTLLLIGLGDLWNILLFTSLFFYSTGSWSSPFSLIMFATWLSFPVYLLKFYSLTFLLVPSLLEEFFCSHPLTLCNSDFGVSTFLGGVSTYPYYNLPFSHFYSLALLASSISSHI